MYPNEENMIVVPITKRMEIILISKFVENMIIVLMVKNIDIITSFQVSLFARMNFDYEENGGKKNFSYKSKASSILMWRK